MRVDLGAFRFLLLGKFWKGLWNEINDDDCWGMAAQLSYYFLMAFFPFLIFLSALIGFIPVGPDALGRFLAELNIFMPDSAYDWVTRFMERLQSRGQSVIPFSIMLSLWFGSLAFNGMISVFNQAYQAKETRSYLLTRSLSILVTVIVSVFLVLSMVLLFFGDWLIRVMSDLPSVRFWYSLIRWLLIFLLLNVGVQIMYYALPAKRFPWRLISPGGILATTGSVVGTLIFRRYVNVFFENFEMLWGSLSALIALMVWFYICSFCLLVGGEIDSEIFKLRRDGVGVLGR